MLLSLLGLLCAGVSMFCGTVHVYAHAQGRSIERDAGAYLVDIGYTPDPVVAGDQVRFDFKLWQKTPADAAKYSDVWVRIMRGEVTLFATGVAHNELGTTGLLYTFDTPGEYQVMARYETGDTSLAETTFTVEVEQPSGKMKESTRAILLCLGGVVAGAFAVFVITQVRRRRVHGIV